MSFRCDNCGEAQETGTQPIKFVSKIRPAKYPERWKQVHNSKPIKIDEGGEGWEIVKEELLCPSCHMALLEETGLYDSEGNYAF